MKHRKRACLLHCVLMTDQSGIFSKLKQAKDPCLLRELNKYMKFRSQLAVAITHVRFLDDCINQCVFPKRYWTILRRNHVKITKCSLKRQAYNERDSWLDRRTSLERQVFIASEALQHLTDEEAEQFEAYVHCIESQQSEVKNVKLRKQLMA